MPLSSKQHRQVFLAVTFSLFAFGLKGQEDAPDKWFPDPSGASSLTLSEFRKRVFARNEQIQMQLIGVLIAEKNYLAALGEFEPAFVSDIQHVDSSRPNTAEQASSQSGLGVFNERNNLYNNGIEARLPTNADVRLGFNVLDLQNNLQRLNPDRTTPEYSIFFGANITQPLLRNAGLNAGLAAVRIAAGESKVAFEDYRRQMMATVGAAEAAYWGVFVAAQDVQFARESVDLAKSILKDAETALPLGGATQTQVDAAKVAVLERVARLTEAQQRHFESANTMISYFSGDPIRKDSDLPSTSPPPQPSASDAKKDRTKVYNTAFTSNPDYVRRLRQLEVEDIRVTYAKNQKLPQLDLKASYGLNGLGDDFSSGFDDIEGTDFPAWSVGLEMRIPLGGNRTGRAQFDAAEARKAQAILGLKELEIQLNIAIENAIRQIDSTIKSFEANSAAVRLRKQLLADERAKLKEGKSSARLVLELDEDLSESEAAALLDLLQVQTAKLQFELVTGTVLSNRGLEKTSEELRESTQAIVESVSNNPKSKNDNDREITESALPSSVRPGHDSREPVDSPRAGDEKSDPPRKRGFFRRFRSSKR